MHSTSLYGLKLSVLRGVGTKALATDHRATEMIPTTEMIPIRNRNDPAINFWNLGLNGLGTLLSILNSSFIHANRILNRGK